MLLNYELFNGLPSGDITRALEAHRAMGYHFVVDRISISTPNACSYHVPFGAKCVNVVVQVRNAGIARFYYPLSLIVQDAVSSVNSSTRVKVSHYFDMIQSYIRH